MTSEKRTSDGHWVGAVVYGHDTQGRQLRKTVSAMKRSDADHYPGGIGLANVRNDSSELMEPSPFKKISDSRARGDMRFGCIPHGTPN